MNSDGCKSVLFIRLCTREEKKNHVNESTHFPFAIRILDFTAIQMDTQRSDFIFCFQQILLNCHRHLIYRFEWLLLPLEFFSPSCDCRTRFFTIQFSMHGQHFVHKLRWIVHSVWTTVGNVLIIFPMLFFFLFHFHSIISDEIYIYNSKTCFRLLYKWKCFRKKTKDKFRLIVCMCMKNH